MEWEVSRGEVSPVLEISFCCMSVSFCPRVFACLSLFMCQSVCLLYLSVSLSVPVFLCPLFQFLACFVCPYLPVCSVSAVWSVLALCVFVHLCLSALSVPVTVFACLFCLFSLSCWLPVRLQVVFLLSACLLIVPPLISPVPNCPPLSL